MDQLVEPLLHDQQQHVYRERCLPILKWFFWLHGLMCTVGVWRSQPTLFEETWICYGALLNLMFALFLWAKNLEIFYRANVNLERDLLLGENEHLGPNDIFQFIRWMLMAGTSTFTMHFLLYSFKESEKWTAVPAILYIAIAIYLITDKNSPYHHSLLDLGKRLWQNILLFSAEDPKFSNTFVADVMTSMMKVFVDIGSLLCRVAAAMLGLSIAFCATSHGASILKSSILVLPNLIRLIQCIRLYRDVRNIVYVGKYLLASIVICLSQFHFGDWPFTSSIASPTYFYIWLGLSIYSSLYSIYCDMFLDWDMSRLDELLTSHQSIPFSNHSTWGFFLASGINFLFRFSWVLKFSLPALVNQHFIDFLITFLEIYRRFQATIFRVHTFVSRENQRLAEIATEEQHSQQQAEIATEQQQSQQQDDGADQTKERN